MFSIINIIKKSCPTLREACIFGMIVKCATINVFGDNHVFDFELIFLLPLILKAIEK